MHLRRALLLMAAVLIAVAAVQALIPVPRGPDRLGSPAAPAAPPPPPKPAPKRALVLRYPAPKALPVRMLRPGTHFTLRVASAASGEVTLHGLGLIQPVEPRTPALFDALASRHGSYDVDFAPVVGRPVRLGRVVVSESSRRP